MPSFKQMLNDSRGVERASSAALSSPANMRSGRGAPVVGAEKRLSQNSDDGTPETEEARLVKLNMGLADEEPEQAAGCTMCRTAWLYPELPWGAPPTWGKQRSIHRGVQFLKFWDCLLFFELMYVAFSVPYQIGFNSADGRSVCVFEVQDRMGVVFAALDAVADTIFTLDIIMNFFIARWIVSSVGTPHWELVNDLPRIRRMYLKGAFAVDVIGQIPWQYLDCVFPAVDSELKLLRLLRLMKLFRLHRITRMIQAIKRKFPRSELLITAGELTMTMCIVAHWMCCVWFSVGYPNGWVLTEGLTTEMPDGTFESQRNFHEWVSSFYWAITTMSTIGYGDISASTTLERGVASVVMVLGCGFFAWATGRLTNILTKKSICSEAFESKMSQLQEYFVNRGISDRLVDKAMSYYMLKFPTLRLFDEDSILLDLPRELSKELLVELYADVIQDSPIFGVLSKEVQKELCYRIRPQFVEAGAVIFAEGDAPREMYVVRFGYVQLSSRGEELLSAQRGDVFGELEMVGLSSTGERRRTARAVTVCDLCVIAADDWWELLRAYPLMGKKISMMSKKLVTDLEHLLRTDQCVSTTELLCPRWDIAADYARAKLSSAKKRQLAAVSQVAGASLPLRTWLEMEFTGLEFARAEDVPMCAVFIVVTCTDENGNEGAVGESTLFQVRAEGHRARIQQPVKVLVFHSKNDWKALPDLKVRVYQPGRLPSADEDSLNWTGRFYEPPRKALADRLSRLESGSNRREIEDITGADKNKQARLDSERRQKQKHSQPFLRQRSRPKRDPFLSQKGRRKKLDSSFSQRSPSVASGSEPDKFADCTTLWEGTLPLAPLVHRRDEDITHRFPIEPPEKLQNVEWNPLGTMTLELKCKVLRMLRPDSRWYAVLPVLAAKGAAMGSEFFKRRREQEVHNMRVAADNFGQATVALNKTKLLARKFEKHQLLEGLAALQQEDTMSPQDMSKYVDDAVTQASFHFKETLVESGLVAAEVKAHWRQQAKQEQDEEGAGTAEAGARVAGPTARRAGSEESARRSEEERAASPFGSALQNAFIRVRQAEAGEQTSAAEGGGAERGGPTRNEEEAGGGGIGEAGVARLLRQQEEMVRGQRAMEERISVVEKGMDRITQLLQTLVDERTAAPRLASQPAADSGSQHERGGSGERDGAVSESQSGVELSLRGEPNAHFDYSSDAETPRALLEAQPKNWLERRGRQ